MPHPHATPNGTVGYFNNRAVNPDNIRKLDGLDVSTIANGTSHGDPGGNVRRLDGLSVSALAVGTYLGDSDSATDRLYEETLVHAGLNGINFFDTAVNYRCQRSERNIAYALRKLAGLGVPRESFVVATKGGFLTPDGSPENFVEYINKCYLNTGIIKPEDIVAGCHCMTPKYLESQINLSLANLKVDCIDLYYLHNPETQLREIAPGEFYARLTRAFVLFEQQVAAGKIRRYGIATWNAFRVPSTMRESVDLEKVIACAREAGGADHHFSAVQLPYNLAMLEAVALKNQKIGGEDFPFIPTAVHHGVAVLVSAPLYQGNIVRLPAKVFEAIPGDLSPLQKALQFVTSSPGVVAAMTGMKRVTHAEENLKVLREANLGVEKLQEVVKLLVR